jgi:hypothetical protein
VSAPGPHTGDLHRHAPIENIRMHICHLYIRVHDMHASSRMLDDRQKEDWSPCDRICKVSIVHDSII